MEQWRQHPGKGRLPRLDRRNAVKNIEYEAESSTAGGFWSSPYSEDESPGLRTTRSLDLSPSSYSKQTSFRIGGSIEGEVDLLCRSLGLKGPEDFAIPVTAWEARKARSNSDLLPRSRLLHPDSPAPPDPTFATNSTPADADPPNVPAEESVGRQDVEEVPGEPDGPVVESNVLDGEKPKNLTSPPVVKPGDGGIRGVRPPVLAPPPLISTLSPPPGRRVQAPAIDSGGSTWDLLKSFAPDEEINEFGAKGRRSFNSEEDEREEARPAGGEVAGLELRLGETSEDFTGTSSYSTMNDDDASSTTTETMFIISPNGKFKRRIRSWMRGVLLGSGSFGMVYEGISE